VVVAVAAARALSAPGPWQPTMAAMDPRAAAYALPAHEEILGSLLAGMRQFTDDLTTGATDSGAKGSGWKHLPLSELPRVQKPVPPSVAMARAPKAPLGPPPARQRPRGGSLQTGSQRPGGPGLGQQEAAALVHSLGQGPSSYNSNNNYSSSSSNNNNSGPVEKATLNPYRIRGDMRAGLQPLRYPGQLLPSMSKSATSSCFSDEAQQPRRPVSRHLSCAIPRNYHSALDLDLSPIAPILTGHSKATSSRSPGRREVFAPTPLLRPAPSWATPRRGREGGPIAVTQRVAEDEPGAASRVNGPKSLEEYVAQARSDLLLQPGRPVLRWSVADSVADRQHLRPEEFFNHFGNNRALTTKVGLATTLAQYAASQRIDVDTFFPRCYDLSQRNDREDFVLDFRRSACLTITMLHLHLDAERRSGRGSAAVYRVDLDILEAATACLLRWSQDLDPEWLDEEGEEQPVTSVSDDLWDEVILYSELTESQLLRKPGTDGAAEDDSLIPAARRHGGFRMGGGVGAFPEGALSRAAQLEERRHLRPEDWPQFKNHRWGDQDETSRQQLEDLVAGLQASSVTQSCRRCLHGGRFGRNIWILKPGTNSKGSGIECKTSLAEILHQGESMPNRMVQKYVERPLLLMSGRKFDLRLWVLVTSVTPLKAFVFSDCYLRLCNGMYDVGDLSDRERHISNWQVNRNGRHDHVAEGAVTSLEAFCGELKELTGQQDYWDSMLFPQIRKLILTTLLAAEEQLEPRDRSFELFGFDVLVDEALRPWLLEVNLSPGCDSRTPFLEAMLARMSKRLVEIAVLGMEEGDGEMPDWVNITDQDPDSSAEAPNNNAAARAGANANSSRPCATGAKLQVVGEAVRLPRFKRTQKPSSTKTRQKETLPEAEPEPERQKEQKPQQQHSRKDPQKQAQSSPFPSPSSSKERAGPQQQLQQQQQQQQRDEEVVGGAVGDGESLRSEDVLQEDLGGSHAKEEGVAEASDSGSDHEYDEDSDGESAKSSSSGSTSGQSSRSASNNKSNNNSRASSGVSGAGPAASGQQSAAGGSGSSAAVLDPSGNAEAHEPSNAASDDEYDDDDYQSESDTETASPTSTRLKQPALATPTTCDETLQQQQQQQHEEDQDERQSVEENEEDNFEEDTFESTTLAEEQQRSQPHQSTARPDRSPSADGGTGRSRSRSSSSKSSSRSRSSSHHSSEV